MASSYSHNDNHYENLEMYSIIWLDAAVNNEQNLKAQKQLRTIINRLQIFVDSDEFMTHIQQIYQDDRTVLIVSGQMGRIVVPEMQKLPQVSSIYIYCINKVANQLWSEPFSKVRIYSSSNLCNIS